MKIKFLNKYSSEKIVKAKNRKFESSPFESLLFRETEKYILLTSPSVFLKK